MRLTRIHRFLLQLALLAAVLMAVAPVISRWQQSHQAGHAQMRVGMAMPAATQPADPHAAHHGMHAAHQHPASGAMAPAARPTSPADPHAAHGEACDYCSMASRLLPWLALLLVLPPLLYRLSPWVPRSTALPPSLRWPAHPARGPPPLS
ncbi:DUF2946 family protein [Stenotrophomonas sp.]|uniref:DUF2946 family protein n=1 Tax=Stenotrophomonas sp. TaxID=69392 RepID=UPI00289A8C0B|nr:DUF2946 family protein [Stenotrophomonas sp.]